MRVTPAVMFFLLVAVIMESILASLEGETNWLTSSERAGRLGTAAGWWIGIAVAVIAVLAWRKRRARSA